MQDYMYYTYIINKYVLKGEQWIVLISWLVNKF